MTSAEVIRAASERSGKRNMTFDAVFACSPIIAQRLNAVLDRFLTSEHVPVMILSEL